MEKIANYLNKNIEGETLTNPNILERFSYDNSILKNRPQIVVAPRHTDDIRKTVKFCDQLATKGMKINITARGYGNDQTGAAIGDGILINMPQYLKNLVDFDEEQNLAHVQAGISLASLNQLILNYKMRLPINHHNETHTLAGVISNGLVYPFFRNDQDLINSIDQLEVILANGDLLQTKKLSKRELSKKIGQGDSEGNIYRQIDTLIEDNQELINSIPNNSDNYGYHNITKVKQKDGSINLSPLFVGTQGTLGIISEAIIKLEALSNHLSEGLIIADSLDQAMDLADELLKMKLAELNIFDSRLFQNAKRQGNYFDYFEILEQKLGKSSQFIIYYKIEAKTKIALMSSIKKISKITEKISTVFITDQDYKIKSINNLPDMFDFNTTKNVNIPLVKGIKISRVQWREMTNILKTIEQQIGREIPFYGSLLTEIVNFQTAFDLTQINEKQTALKLISHLKNLTDKLEGTFCASGGEGQIKNFFINDKNNPAIIELYQKIKNIFDPNHILNTKVKQPLELRDLATNLVNNYQNDYYRH